jgi:hypothetical protein
MSHLNLTATLERIIADMVGCLEELSHIEPARLLVSVARSRQGARHRILARIHPLRFQGGERSQVRSRGRQRYLLTMPRVDHRGDDALYLIYFHLPRFLELPFRQKLVTILHELYHISPAFDGDLRRFPGRTYAHGSSRQKYDRLMGDLADRYLGLRPSPPELAILDMGHEELRQRYPLIVGRTLPAPRIAVSRLSG